MANVLRTCFRAFFAIKAVMTFSLPVKSILIFPRLSQYYSWEFNSFFQQDISHCLQPMKLFYISVPILRHGNLSAQRIQFYRASLRQCNSLHSLWDCGPHSQISYATRPYYSARALSQCYGWSFISLHKCFAGYRHGSILTFLSIINAIVHFGDVRLSTVYFYFQSDYNLHLRPVSNFNNSI